MPSRYFAKKKKSTGFNMKNKGNFDFGNKGNIDFHKGTASIDDPATEIAKTQNNPVIISEKSNKPKHTKKSY